jgi:hypothetical protein
LEAGTTSQRCFCPGLIVVLGGDIIGSAVFKQNQRHLPITFDQLEGGFQPVATLKGVGRRFVGVGRRLYLGYIRKIVVGVYIRAGED